MPPFGSPLRLLDWRWLAQPYAGQHGVQADAEASRALPATADGEYEVVALEGPGILEHLWTADAQAAFRLEVDGEAFWTGRLARATAETPLPGFPWPVAFSASGMNHLLAPVAFRERLTLRVDRERLPHFLSYRSLTPGTPLWVPVGDNRPRYDAQLQAVSEAWRQDGFGLEPDPGSVERTDFVLPPNGRAEVFAKPASGCIRRLEFHLFPALLGTLRNVVVEVFCDGETHPRIRLPLPELTGLPHPWPSTRWEAFNGTLAAGIRYPWYLRQPRVYFTQAAFHFNLPMPYADGMRIELHNRSESQRFTGYLRSVVEPICPAEAAGLGRLCARRKRVPLPGDRNPVSILEAPGGGHLVGLSLFLSGRDRYVSACGEISARRCLFLRDAETLVAGPAWLPLFLSGSVRGPVVAPPIWTHPQFTGCFAGVTRHFFTDPVPFRNRLALVYDPGPPAAANSEEAIGVALWYADPAHPYSAPPLAATAKALAAQTHPFQPMHRRHGFDAPRLFWASEAEDLAPFAMGHAATARRVEDRDRNYNCSGSAYLLVAAEHPQAHVDIPLRLPNTRYLAVGYNPIEGPGQGTFEIAVLCRASAQATAGRIPPYGVGRQPPRASTVQTGGHYGHVRGFYFHHAAPFLNPAPDAPGIVRFICRAPDPHGSGTALLKLDRLRIDTPPATPRDWHEAEDLLAAHVCGGLRAAPAPRGDMRWSGWGALRLESFSGGRTELVALAPTPPDDAAALTLRGALGPGRGSWEARLLSGSPQDLSALGPAAEDDTVLEWTLPLDAPHPRGPVRIEIVCTADGQPRPRSRTPEPAVLILDAWRFSASVE